MIDVVPYEERWLGRLLDFSVRAAPEFFFSWAGSEELFRWKLVEQPCLGAGEQVPLWLAVEGGQIIGVRAAMLSDYWFGGRSIRGGVGGDYYVEEAYQGRGIGRRLLTRAIEVAPLQMNLSGTARVHGIQLSFEGYREIRGVSTFLTIHHPLAAARWLIRRKLHGPAGRSTPRPIDAVRDWTCGQPGVAVAREQDEAALNELLSKAQRRFNFAALRDMRFLKWKYRNHPERHGDVFTWHDGGKLSGVFALANQNRGGLNILVLGDLYLCEPNAAATAHFAQLLHGAARAIGADASGAFGSWDVLTATCRRGIFKHVRPHRATFMLKGSDQDLNPGSCYISAGDGDYLC